MIMIIMMIIMIIVILTDCFLGLQCQLSTPCVYLSTGIQASTDILSENPQTKKLRVKILWETPCGPRNSSPETLRVRLSKTLWNPESWFVDWPRVDSRRGNHLSNTTCITRVFFKSGEQCSEFNQQYQTSNAIDDKWGCFRHVALDE